MHLSPVLSLRFLHSSCRKVGGNLKKIVFEWKLFPGIDNLEKKFAYCIMNGI